MHRSPEIHAWERRLGATPVGGGLTEFRVWAPRAAEVAVRVGGARPRADPRGRRDARGAGPGAPRRAVRVRPRRVRGRGRPRGCYDRPFHHQGQYSSFRRRRFGAPADDRPVEQFVVFSANHDQVGNRALGDRLPDDARALAAFATLLAPFTPMLFMGEEYGEQPPFRFFSDHIDEELAQATRDGRRREFAAFAGFAGEEVPDPQALRTFEESVLTRREAPGLRELHAGLLRQRRRPGGGPVVTAAGGEAGTLLAIRGDSGLAMNFVRVARRLPAGRRAVALQTHPASVEDGAVVLAPLAGALLR